MWKCLDHPNIVAFKGVTLDPLQLVSEWMSGGELQKYLKKHPDADLISLVGSISAHFRITAHPRFSCLASQTVLLISIHVTWFMETLKECVLLLVLEPQISQKRAQPNILVDGSGNARIMDFGLASIVRDPSSVASTSDGHGYSPRWTAPEVLRGAPASKKSDVFSFAMVAYEVRAICS